MNLFSVASSTFLLNIRDLVSLKLTVAGTLSGLSLSDSFLRGILYTAKDRGFHPHPQKPKVTFNEPTKVPCPPKDLSCPDISEKNFLT